MGTGQLLVSVYEIQFILRFIIFLLRLLKLKNNFPIKHASSENFKRARWNYEDEFLIGTIIMLRNLFPILREFLKIQWLVLIRMRYLRRIINPKVDKALVCLTIVSSIVVYCRTTISHWAQMVMKHAHVSVSWLWQISFSGFG